MPRKGRNSRFRLRLLKQGQDWRVEDGFYVAHYLAKEIEADVNIPGNEGTTPLFVAAQENHLDVVRCLGTELEADVNKRDNEGTTPFFVAAQENHLGVVRCLGTELGTNVNKARDDCFTPLIIAAQVPEHHNDHVVNCLLKMQADPQLRCVE